MPVSASGLPVWVSGLGLRELSGFEVLALKHLALRLCDCSYLRLQLVSCLYRVIREFRVGRGRFPGNLVRHTDGEKGLRASLGRFVGFGLPNKPVMSLRVIFSALWAALEISSFLSCVQTEL